MELDYLATVLLSSLSSASILLIATIGLAVVYGLMGVINLAHGEFLMVGAYSALTATQIGIPYPLAIPVAILVTMLIGAIVELLIIRRLYGRLFDTMLATWGLGMVFNQGAVLLFGTVSPGIGMPQINFKIGDYSLAAYPIAMIAVAAIMLAFVYFLMTKTVYGMKARASIQEPKMAQAIGIDSSRVNTLTFAIGCGLAGFAGAILLPIIPATPSMGLFFAVKGFLTVVVAGPVTLTGSAIAALGLGGGASVTATISGILDPYLAFVATSWIIFGLLALSLDVIWGRGGLLSLAQTAFYGLGGYFGSVIAVNMAPSTGISLIWALPSGAAFGALVAAALGYIIFYARMGELQSTILSYTFTLLLWSVTQTFKFKIGEAVIGGDNGFSNIPGIILGIWTGSRNSRAKPCLCSSCCFVSCNLLFY
ncbi:High-affinity branched-chain amino acid transport system permease protein BraD [Nymphon striatum]|nr:High-affinity branched-chain amino acid transport system permease protein BraD [Nymphon striatum]